MKDCKICKKTPTTESRSSDGMEGRWSAHAWIICKKCGITVDAKTKQKAAEVWGKLHS